MRGWLRHTAQLPRPVGDEIDDGPGLRTTHSQLCARPLTRRPNEFLSPYFPVLGTGTDLADAPAMMPRISLCSAHPPWHTLAAPRQSRFLSMLSIVGTAVFAASLLGCGFVQIGKPPPEPIAASSPLGGQPLTGHAQVRDPGDAASRPAASRESATEETQEVSGKGFAVRLPAPAGECAFGAPDYPTIFQKLVAYRGVSANETEEILHALTSSCKKHDGDLSMAP